MRDIHSIGQAFKIVSERTAKGRADIKSSDEKNNVEAMTADELLASQEFPPQNKLTKRVIAFPFDYDLPIKATEEFISIIENIREQAREEMLKEIPCPQMTNSSISECVCEWCKSFKEEQLGEGEKK